MNKKTLYQFLFPVMIAGIGTLSISCNGDDSGSDLPNIPSEPAVPEKNVSEEEPFVGVTCIEDSVKIQLQLLNSDSVAVDTFTEGEDIIFKLSITNLSSDLVITTPILEFSENIFDVYSSDGTYVGKPWDGRLTFLIHSFLTPDMLQEHFCSWLEDPIEDPETKYTEEFSPTARRPIRYYKMERRQPLPEGSYYTQFEVSIIEGKTLTIRMDFNVV